LIDTHTHTNTQSGYTHTNDSVLSFFVSF